MLSKAFLKSIKRAKTLFFSSILRKINSFLARRAVSVENCFRKPCCALEKILWRWTKLIKRVWIAFSRIFEKTGSSEIGQQVDVSVLSPFLNTGVTLAICIFRGNTPSTRHKIKIWASGTAIISITYLLGDIWRPSTSQPVLGFRLRKMTAISSIETGERNTQTVAATNLPKIGWCTRVWATREGIVKCICKRQTRDFTAINNKRARYLRTFTRANHTRDAFL